MKPLGDSFPD